MFNQEEFEKNQFIKEKINYECLAGKAADKIIHIAFNINDAFFMQMGVTVTSVLENNPDKAFAIHIFCDGVSKENLDKTRELAEKYQQIFMYTLWICSLFRRFILKQEIFHE